MIMEDTPKIRFKGFTDAWEQRKIGEITELKSASRVHKGEWTIEGVPFYRSSDVMAAINGTKNDKAFISEELYEKLSSISGKLEEGDILVTGGGSVGNPYIVPNNAPLYTKDADLLWIKNQGRFNPYFVYEFFLSPSFRNYLGSISHVGTIAHYTITQLSETPISLPSVEEQGKLGEYFQDLDHLITLHQRKCDDTKELKKYMLQKIFPQNGRKIPEIRFAGFTGDWEQRKVTDLGEIYIGLVTTMTAHYTNHGTLLIRNSDIKDSHFEFGDNPIYLDEGFAEKNSSRKHKLGDVITVHTGDIGTSAVITEKEVGSIGFATIVTRPNLKEITSEFLCTYLNTDTHKKFAFGISTGDGRNNYNLKDYYECVIPVPDIKEQKKISNYIESLNRLITFHQRKCNELKEVKHFMLHNMFPQKG